MSDKPEIKQDEMFQLLRMDNIQEFNTRRAQGETCDLRNGNLRGSDLRGLDAKGLDFGDAYLRDCNLGGIDFRESNLEGASLNNAKISGAYFPDELGPREIRLSVDKGTRMRYSKKKLSKAEDD